MLSSSVKSFFSGTLLSRVSGMARDVMMAFTFGAHPAVAAFMVAFRLSHLLRRIFGEGPLQSAFIPYFEGLKVQNPLEAAHFFRKLSLLLLCVLVFIVGVAEGVLILSPYYFSISSDNTYVMHLTAWMMPSLIFICLYGLNLSLLQCHESFFLPSFAPFVCNMIWVAGILFLQGQEPEEAMFTLTKFTLLGFAAQWVITVPSTLKHISGQVKDWFSRQTFTLPKEFKHFVKAFLLGTIGVSATQVNVFVDSVLARYADLSGPVYLWYAIRLEQLALALFGMACVGTIVPLLSRQIKSGNRVTAQALFSDTYRLILTIMIPCTFALIALGCASVNLIYGRGHFEDAAVTETSLCLWAYGIGLIPATTIMLFSAILYAEGDFKTSTRLAFVSVAINVVLNMLFVFVFHLGAISIAIATSLSAWINSALLRQVVTKKSWETARDPFRTFHLLMGSSLACLFSIGIEFILWNSGSFLLLTGRISPYPHGFIQQIFVFATLAASYVVFLWLYAVAFNNRDLIEVFRNILGKKKRQEISLLP